MKLLDEKMKLLEQNVVFWQRPMFIANFRVWKGKLASFEVTLKTVSEKMKKIELLRINAIFVHWIIWLTFTETMKPIGEGPKFALSVLTRTAS